MHAFEKTPREAQELLRKPIKDLGLKIEGSVVERYIHQLYRELELKGLHHFRPSCYLTDEWGCPSEEPVIGIPFYLADPKVAALERAVNDLEDDREIMMYMRHEAGHAFNYAYELYRTDEWRKLFGPFRRPYRDDYRPMPFSRKYVRHIAGWYAQKHPDEDFAETFAVWLTPRSNWRKRYQGWGAMQKLRYVERIAKSISDIPPPRDWGEYDLTVEEMESTIEDFYRDTLPNEAREIDNLAIDADLTDIFLRAKGKKDVRPAKEFISDCRKAIVDKVAYWTGLRRPLVKTLVEAIQHKAAEQNLLVDRDRERSHLVEITAYATALAMNYVSRGQFVPDTHKESAAPSAKRVRSATK